MSPMTELTPTQRAALELAVEDHYGLWEILWRITGLRPELSSAAATELARADVAELLTRDLVRLYALADDDAAVRLDPSETHDRLADPLSWHEPSPGAPRTALAATDLGVHRYYER